MGGKSLKWLLLKNDLVRNKSINLALFLFIMMSAVLAVLSVIVAVHTFTSIAEFYKIAQPPHFLQMHKGEIDQERIDDFIASSENITYWQTIPMIGIHGESFTVVRNGETFDLSNARLDIGLVKQNETKDLLLNSSHEKVRLHKGEMGIPVLLKNMFGIEIGDHILLTSNNGMSKFVVKEFILDSMMNSTMASSTRILVSESDFDMLEGQVGETEYLIEAYFTNTDQASSFQTAYENAGLPQNGQAITYPIILLLSALTDLTTVFISIIVSLLLITVSFICVKYTLMATLEEEIREIGTLKAIGLTFSDIRDIYLHKYKAIAMASVIVGYIVALLISGVFTNHISTTFGNTRLSFLTLLVSFAVGCVVYVLIIRYCKKLVIKTKNLTVVETLLYGKGIEDNQNGVRDGLYKSRKLPVNLVLSVREVFFQAKSWMIVFAVVLIAIVMMLVPLNVINTLKAPDFITYMGSSLEDILIEVENGENLEVNYTNVKQLLDHEKSILRYNEFRRVRVQTTSRDGELMNLHIDSGKQSGTGLQYLSGNAPIDENEIAISYLNGEKIGKNTGETILLIFEGKEHEFTISGIYQDVTSGGFTAKSTHPFSPLKTQKYTFSVNLHDQGEAEKKASVWSAFLGAGTRVSPMQDVIDQTLGGVVKQLSFIVIAIVMIGTALAILVTILFLKLRLAKDSSEIAALKAIGFSNLDIQKQYLLKVGSISITGILVGVLVTDLFGEKIINIALTVAGLGVKKIELIVNPFVAYILCPTFLMLMILTVCWIVLASTKKYMISK